MAGLKLEDGHAAFADFVEDAHANHGLKQIVFCAERELPLHSTPRKKSFFSLESEVGGRMRVKFSKFEKVAGMFVGVAIVGFAVRDIGGGGQKGLV